MNSICKLDMLSTVHLHLLLILMLMLKRHFHASPKDFAHLFRIYAPAMQRANDPSVS